MWTFDFRETFKCTHLTKHANNYVHAHAQCSLTSVRLARFAPMSNRSNGGHSRQALSLTSGAPDVHTENICSKDGHASLNLGIKFVFQYSL